MLAKANSGGAATPASSPAQSPPRRLPSGPVYYVQSPLRKFHEDEKTTANSYRSSPAATPPRGPASGATRISGTGKGGGREDGWQRFDAVEEEESLLGPGEEEPPAVPRRWVYAGGFVVGFFVLFSFFSLVLWGASRNQKPIISMKSVRFEDFDVHAGTDNSGVATTMVTMNVTLKLVYRNRGAFFGTHVSSSDLDLYHKQVVVAVGSIDNFYQKRKSQRVIRAQLKGASVAVYGAGSDLSSKDGAPVLPVGLTLDFRVRSRAYVLGRVVKPKFHKSINCPLVMDPKNMKVSLSLKRNCTYT